MFRRSSLGIFPLRAARRHLASRCNRVLSAGEVPLDLADFSHVMALVPLHHATTKCLAGTDKIFLHFSAATCNKGASYS